MCEEGAYTDQNQKRAAMGQGNFVAKDRPVVGQMFTGDLHGAGPTSPVEGPKRMARPLTGTLREMRRQLESRLHHVNRALQLVEANPVFEEHAEFIDLIDRIGLR